MNEFEKYFDTSKLVGSKNASAEELIGEAKLKKVNEKITDGDSDSVVWSELMAEMLSLQQSRVNAVIKRLTMSQLRALEEAIHDTRSVVKEKTLEKYRSMMLKDGISLADLGFFIEEKDENHRKSTLKEFNKQTGTITPKAPKPPKPRAKKRANRDFIRSAKIYMETYLLEKPSRIELPTKELREYFTKAYPELTSTDVSKAKIEAKKKL